MDGRRNAHVDALIGANDAELLPHRDRNRTPAARVGAGGRGECAVRASASVEWTEALVACSAAGAADPARTLLATAAAHITVEHVPAGERLVNHMKERRCDVTRPIQREASPGISRRREAGRRGAGLAAPLKTTCANERVDHGPEAT